jgi:hypothetical protein
MQDAVSYCIEWLQKEKERRASGVGSAAAVDGKDDQA